MAFAVDPAMVGVYIFGTCFPLFHDWSSLHTVLRTVAFAPHQGSCVTTFFSFFMFHVMSNVFHAKRNSPFLNVLIVQMPFFFVRVLGFIVQVGFARKRKKKTISGSLRLRGILSFKVFHAVRDNRTPHNTIHTLFCTHYPRIYLTFLL